MNGNRILRNHILYRRGSLLYFVHRDDEGLRGLNVLQSVAVD